MVERTTSAPLGYTASIRPGLWQRLKRMGAPRGWTYPWMFSCGWLALYAFKNLGFRWSCAVVGLFVVGQAILALLTTWNSNWDRALHARWRRRYQSYYRAG